MGNTVSASDISEECKYYTYYGKYLLTVCIFERIPARWFDPIDLIYPKLLSIQDNDGQCYKSLSLLCLGLRAHLPGKSLCVGKCVKLRTVYYSHKFAAKMNMRKYLIKQYNGRLTDYTPLGKLFVVCDPIEDITSTYADKYLIDSLVPCIIATKINGKFQLNN